MGVLIDSKPNMIYNVYHKEGDSMKAKLSSWGNSLGIRIPNAIAEMFHFKSGSMVNVDIKNNAIILTPEKKDITSVMEEFYNKPLAEITREDVGTTELIDWGSDVGGEVIE